MFDEATACVSRSAGKFLEMMIRFDNVAERARELKNEEESCDKIIERIFKALDLSFITPLDREDIHTLATTLDEVLDNLEETAHRFAVFRIVKPTEEAVVLARNIVDCCAHLEQAIALCRNMKNSEKIYAHVGEIRRLENEADRIYRNADAAFFSNGPAADILNLIKLREIYSWLEETVDACKSVANVVSEIVIKGS